ncbi:MAG: DNA polymerase III subunit delta, partial [Parcubacteria group bacterium Gr01-1014_2]
DSFNLHKFDLETDDQNEIRNAIKENSFFKQVKFIVVKNPFAKSDFLEKVIKESDLEKQKGSVLLLYQTGEQEKFSARSGSALGGKSSKLFALLTKIAQIKEFKPPTTQAMNKFAMNYLAKNELSIKKEILAKLVKETGPDLWRLKNELDKIAYFAKTENKKSITEEDLAKLVNFKIDHNIFNIIDAAFSNQGKALTLFEDYLSSGGDPLYLLSMIAYQLKNMLIVRELIDKKYQYVQILKKTKMHPYFFKKNYEVTQKYTLNDLKNIFQKVVNFEIGLKTGQVEAENIFFKIFL